MCSVSASSKTYHAVCNYLGLTDLHNLSMTCKTMRKMVARVHYDRYLDLLRPYSVHSLHEFQHVLEDSSAVIIGSAALSLILRPTNWHPNDLNIAVPRASTFQLHSWLLNNGYQVTRQSQHMFISLSMQHSVNSHRTFINRLKPNLKITLTESIDDTILSIVLANRYSSDMLYVTAQGIFCAHPRLTLDSIILDRNTSDLAAFDVAKRNRYMSMGLLCVQTTGGWDAECGRDCPTLWRSIDNTKDRMLIDWNQAGDRQTINEQSASWHTQGQHYLWRLNITCHNARCTFRLHDIELPKRSPADYEDIIRMKIRLAYNPVRILSLQKAMKTLINKTWL